jgi:hypothetical protein
VAVPVQITTTLPSGNEAAVIRNEYFIEGTEPQTQTVPQGGGGILSRLFHSGSAATSPVAAVAPTPPDNAVPPPPGADASSSPPHEQKGGVLRKFLSIFKGKGNKQESPPDGTEKAPPQQ